jgi:NAD(P)-dependent dehydrogenase (short-subunit alcohol dehydrogenase family)
MLTSLHAPANVVVVGSTGGIGAALTEKLSAHPNLGTLHTIARRDDDHRRLNAIHHLADITDESAVKRAADDIAAAGPIDLAIVATGLLHRSDGIAPEKSLKELAPDALASVFETNCIGPAVVAKHLLPLMRKHEKTVFAAISARVGSISDNRLGGWVSYRASKAALNMVLKTLAIEHARRWPESIVAGLHPGTVDTALSKPFSKRVEPDRLFTPAHAASCLLDVIDRLVPGDSGNTFAWDGARIPF